MRGQPAAVVEARLRPQRKAIGQAVGGDADRARGEPIHRVRLVVGPRHQRREGQLHALRRVAAQDVAVERIEGQRVLVVDRARADLRKHAALGRLGIDVVEMRKVGRILQVAERRHAVPLGVARPAAAAPPKPIAPDGDGAGADAREARGATVRSRARSHLRRLGLDPTTRPSGSPRSRISAADRAGRSDPSGRCEPCRRSIAARRRNSTAARGRAPWWRRPDRRGSWRRSAARSACPPPGS